MRFFSLFVCWWLGLTTTALGQSPQPSSGEQMLANYLRAETERIAKRSGAAAKDADTWNNQQVEMRRQLFDMFSLDPLPERGDLKPVVTGTVERDGVVVEKLHFQSLPGLYVTANLYRPKEISKPLPTVLYVCGHGGPKYKQGDISFGNKTIYSHHGCWFAKNGYVCLMIDTVQKGEIDGLYLHRGTSHFDRWWWLSRGYSPAAVEAWNSIRALDYLETRPEVDRDRIGVTGRSGGGAYSWAIAALDERIKVAVPVAGITDLHNYVVDEAVQGHCDCMFFTNTYGWDYPQYAAMMAPRPLLLANTDKDDIFPLDGVLRVHHYLRKVYGFSKANDRLGLQISEGPHLDTPELQVAAFRWMNRFLKNEDPPIKPAVPLFSREELRVFDQLPTDEINTRIDELFAPCFTLPPLSQSQDAWQQTCNHWKQSLQEKCFRAWPAESETAGQGVDIAQISSTTNDDLRLTTYEFSSQQHFKLRIWQVQRVAAKSNGSTRLVVLDETDWPGFSAHMKQQFSSEEFADAPSSEEKATQKTASEQTDSTPFISERLTDDMASIIFFAPRGVGPTAWDVPEKRTPHIRRQFLLLGQTLDGMQVYDIRLACQAIRSLEPNSIQIEAAGQMAGNALYASLFESNVARLDLHDLPTSHHDGPYLLNVLRVLDMPQAVAMAASGAEVHLHGPQSEYKNKQGNEAWNYVRQVQKQLPRDKQLIRFHAD